jgi:hypothetical protein
LRQPSNLASKQWEIEKNNFNFEETIYLNSRAVRLAANRNGKYEKDDVTYKRELPKENFKTILDCY